VSTVPPIRREILVDADPAVAFEVFTAGIGRWWPLEAFDDPAAARAGYDHGWPLVLGRYQEHVGEAGDPRFGQHVAFRPAVAGHDDGGVVR
jgi:hypothetical protein